MDSEKIVQELNQRFAAPLPEFYKRRIVFWYDEDKEFEDKLEKAKNEAVRQLRKRQNKSAQKHETSSNNDAVKIKLVPKKKEIKNKRQKKKMPRKVIQANV